MDRSRAREIPIFPRGRCSRCARARFTIFSDIQSTTLFTRFDVRLSAKLLLEIWHIARETFFLVFFYRQLISGKRYRKR